MVIVLGYVFLVGRESWGLLSEHFCFKFKTVDKLQVNIYISKRGHSNLNGLSPFSGREQQQKALPMLVYGSLLKGSRL